MSAVTLLIASPLYQHARKMKKVEVWSMLSFLLQDWALCCSPGPTAFPGHASVAHPVTGLDLHSSPGFLWRKWRQKLRVIRSDRQQASSMTCCAHAQDPTSTPGLSAPVPARLRQGWAPAPRTLILSAIGPTKPGLHRGPHPDSPPSKPCTALAPYCSKTFNPRKHFWFVLQSAKF